MDINTKFLNNENKINEIAVSVGYNCNNIAIYFPNLNKELRSQLRPLFIERLKILEELRQLRFIDYPNVIVFPHSKYYEK